MLRRLQSISYARKWLYKSCLEIYLNSMVTFIRMYSYDLKRHSTVVIWFRIHKACVMVDFLTFDFGQNRAESIVWDEAMLWCNIRQCLVLFMKTLSWTFQNFKLNYLSVKFWRWCMTFEHTDFLGSFHRMYWNCILRFGEVTSKPETWSGKNL